MFDWAGETEEPFGYQDN